MRYNLNRLIYFAATIEEGTITAAATRLGVSKAVVSKQLQVLENELDQPLLVRNTRRLAPTEAGRVLYEMGKPALVQAEEAYATIADRDRTPKGRLRVASAVHYGLLKVVPLVAQFCDAYPSVDLELILTDERQDMIEQRLDLSFRVGWLKDSSNLGRKLEDFKQIVVATPETASHHPVTAPSDLKEVPFIVISALVSTNPWIFSQGKKKCEVELAPAIVMNVTPAIVHAVTFGRFFTVIPDLLVEADLKEGRLVQLLPDWTLRSGGVYTVRPAGRTQSNALRAFLEMVHQTI